MVAGAPYRAARRFFEDIITAIYSAILKPGDLTVDCGANSVR